jgi:hypothetical protein
MIFPDHIRGKDKDPSFSAKQFRTEDERVNSGMSVGALANFRRLERMTHC